MRTLSREDVVQEFHEAMGIDIDGVWTKALLDLRIKLIKEEYGEFLTEAFYIGELMNSHRPVPPNIKEAFLKELVDLQYVISGLAVALGLPLQQAFNRVHKANMSKLGKDGKPIMRADGKVQKGPNYVPAVLTDLI